MKIWPGRFLTYKLWLKWWYISCPTVLNDRTNCTLRRLSSSKSDLATFYCSEGPKLPFGGNIFNFHVSKLLSHVRGNMALVLCLLYSIIYCTYKLCSLSSFKKKLILEIKCNQSKKVNRTEIIAIHIHKYVPG